MNVEQLFEIQEKVDNKIAENMPDTWEGFGDWKSIHHRTFAFYVEVMELANEIGFFKDWKHSHKINVPAALEELADCIAFLLSVGLSKEYDRVVHTLEPFSLWEAYEFEDLFDILTELRLDNIGKYEMAFSLILGIGLKLGATEAEIVQAYEQKSFKNMERQNNGY